MVNNSNNIDNDNKKKPSDLKELIKKSTSKFKQIILFEKINIDNYDIIEISFQGKNCDRFYCINDETTGNDLIFLNFKKNNAYKNYKQFDILDNEFKNEINIFTFDTISKILNELNNCETNYNISIKKLNNNHNNDNFKIFSIFNYLVNVKKFTKSNLSDYIHTIGNKLNDENTFLGLFLFIPGIINDDYINIDNDKTTTNYKKIFKDKYQKSIQINF